MATATQIVTGSSEAIPNRIPVVIPRSMLRDLAAMYEAAKKGCQTMSINDFVSEIVVNDIASFRRMRIKPESVLANLSEEGEAAPQGDHCRHRVPFTPEEIQVVLHLRFVEHLPVDRIATRFSCGDSTILRVIEAYKGREHNPSNIVWSPKRTHGDPET
jgi:hypothetical protein